MPDEITTGLPPGNTPDLPPEPVGAAPPTVAGAGKNNTQDLPLEPVGTTPSATKNAGKNSTPDLSRAAAQAAPSTQTGAKKYVECRNEPRIHVRWHADAFIDGQEVYRGFLKDISLKGADIFLEHNLQMEKFVRLHIYVPPLSATSDPHVVKVSGKIVYTAHDNDETLFHTGINFLRFNLESDLAYLKSRIASY